MRLLTSQKNQLFKEIEGNVWLSPNQFSFYEGANLTRINHKGSRYFCSFHYHNNDIVFSHSPAEQSLSTSSILSNWAECVSEFKEWLKYLAREISEPDLWGRLDSAFTTANLNNRQEHIQFTVSEYEDLGRKIDILNTQMKMLTFLAEKQVVILEQMDHLLILAKDMSKFDWTNLFVGTLMSIIIQLGVTQENAKTLWDLIRATFKGYFLN
jgi:hypothetical protein